MAFLNLTGKNGVTTISEIQAVGFENYIRYYTGGNKPRLMYTTAQVPNSLLEYEYNSWWDVGGIFNTINKFTLKDFAIDRLNVWKNLNSTIDGAEYRD